VRVDVEGLPRRNGELAFDAPWQPRVFGLAAGVVETQLGGDWEPFRQRLIAAIAADEHRPYWESWTTAVEDLLASSGLVPADVLAALDASGSVRLTAAHGRAACSPHGDALRGARLAADADR
jgi:hypothetical protein